MLIIGTVGVTLITMAHLENQGKISVNKNILYILIGGLGIYCGWWGVGEIRDTFLL